ncbi:MAG: aminotransferase class III-fold pyridoxal phosphate-dependent enzyme, partial [Pseudohongiellaceae bacterium]
HPLVGEVRGKGLIAAVELVANKAERKPFVNGAVGAAAKQFCQEHGLLIRAVAGNSLAFCPPLIINTQQIDDMLDMFSSALDDTLQYTKEHKLLEM